MTKITTLTTHDLRFPTSQSLDGSDAMNLCGERHALCVISSRRTDDAASFLFIWHQRKFVERAANLVGADALKELGFQPHIETRPFAQLSRGEERCSLDVGSDSLSYMLEVGASQLKHRVARDHRFQECGTTPFWPRDRRIL